MPHGQNAAMRANKSADFPKSWDSRSMKPGSDKRTKKITSRKKRRKHKTEDRRKLDRAMDSVDTHGGLGCIGASFTRDHAIRLRNARVLRDNPDPFDEEDYELDYEDEFDYDDEYLEDYEDEEDW